MFVFSPSNIMVYKQCPRRFWGQSISHEIKYRPSKQKSRGMVLHEQIQDAIRDFNNFDALLSDTQIDTAFVHRMVSGAVYAKETDYALHIEHEMCMSKYGDKLGWWDDRAFLRAKADVLLLPEKDDRVPRVIDIKTGRHWDDTDDQLRLEALLVHIIYARPVVRYEYWYVDEGECVDGEIDFRNGLAPVKDLYDTMREMGRAIRNNDFPPISNRFCRWCDFHQTKNCNL